MKISFEKSLVSIGTKQYQVLKPVIDLSNLYVFQVKEHNHIIFGNEHSLEILANLFEYSSNNPNSIIYLNTRNNMLTEYLSECWSNIQKSFDLVILHHSIQLKIHEWKQIRALRLRAMKSHTDAFVEIRNSTRNNSANTTIENIKTSWVLMLDLKHYFWWEATGCLRTVAVAISALRSQVREVICNCLYTYT
ncbi:hypothetical protein ABD86_14550 [Paenibacillus alvei]|nr:hypothetical protein [Paenibacillus alvei]MBG9745102.1 hypothetical protein [Paenibacillus alvei]